MKLKFKLTVMFVTCTSSDSLEISTLSLENNDTLADSSDIELDSYSLHFEDRIENNARTFDRSVSNPEHLSRSNRESTSSSDVTPRNEDSSVTNSVRNEDSSVATNSVSETLRQDTFDTNTTASDTTLRNETQSIASNPEALRNGHLESQSHDNQPLLASEGNVDVRRRKGENVYYDYLNSF